MVPRSYFTRSMIFLGIALVLFLGGCGAVAHGAALQPTNTAPPAATTPPAATATPSAVGFAHLMPHPSGTATLTWDPTNSNTLTVALSLVGLAPANPASYISGSYPATLSSGSCQQTGQAVHQLTELTADAKGAAASTTTIKEVAGGIPAKGWYLEVRAPALAKQGGPIACTNVQNPNTSTTAKQSVQLWIHGMAAAQGRHATFGNARLTLTGTTMTVSLFISGLVPGSKHEVHIHSGSCAQQGPMIYPLNMIVADSSGRAHVVTTIDGVAAIADDWYINVHSGTDLGTQAGFQPIACGNVFVRS